MKKSILITGASGFIGFHLVEQLCTNLETEILALDIEQHSDVRRENVKWIIGNVQDMELVKELVNRVDGVVNLAGVSRLSDGFRRPRECFFSNAVGTLNILDAAREKTPRPWVILGSTREVQEVRLPTDVVLYQNANSMYGLSKLCSELIGERYALDYDMKVLSLRFSDVYGSIRDNPNKVLPKFVIQALRNEEIRVSDKASAMDFTYYRDVIDGILKGIEFVEAGTEPLYEAITICTGRNITLRELAEIIVRAIGSDSSICGMRDQDDNYHHFNLQNDPRRARRLLGFQSRVSLEDGIEKTVIAFRPVVSPKTGL